MCGSVSGLCFNWLVYSPVFVPDSVSHFFLFFFFRVFISLLRTMFLFISRVFTFTLGSRVTYNSYFRIFDNSIVGHHRVGICWFSFLLRIGHIFLILSMSSTFRLILEIMNIFLWDWVLLPRLGSVHKFCLA